MVRVCYSCEKLCSCLNFDKVGVVGAVLCKMHADFPMNVTVYTGNCV